MKISYEWTRLQSWKTNFDDFGIFDLRKKEGRKYINFEKFRFFKVTQFQINAV